MTRQDETRYYNMMLGTGFDFSRNYKVVREFGTTGEAQWGRRYTKPTFGEIERHLAGEIILSLPRFPQSNVYAVDLDNHSGESDEATMNRVEAVIDVLGPPLYLERSMVNGGYHLYFKYQKRAPNYIWRKLPKYFSERYGLTIEVLTERNTLRLPFHPDYGLHGAYNSEKQHLIESQSMDDMLFILRLSKGIETPPLLLGHTRDREYFSTSVSARSKTKNREESLNEYTYGQGTRYDMQRRIAMWMAWRGEVFENYVAECFRLHDGTSVDMNTWSQETIRKNLWDTWSSACKKVQESGRTPFSTTQKQGSRSTEYLLHTDSLADDEREEYRSYLAQFCSFKYAKSQDRFLNGCLDMIAHLLSKREYRTEHRYHYRFKIAKPLEIGVPFGQEEANAFAKAAGVPNIRRIKKFLIEHGVLVPVKNALGREYNFYGVKHTKHFRVAEISEIKGLTHAIS